MGIEPLPLAFEQFKRDRMADFERISRKTRGTHDAEDLKSEAWLIAREIGERRGCRVDLFSPAEQDTVLAWIYKRFVEFVRGKQKESLDQEVDEESSPWHERLAAPEETNPLNQILQLDEQATLPMKGFSQFSAYMILLKRCEMKPLQLATYLAISFVTLRKRIWASRDEAERQPSLFDRTDTVDPEFIPKACWLMRLASKWFGLRPVIGGLLGTERARCGGYQSDFYT